MDILNQIGEGLKQVGSTVANKTNEFATATKLKKELSDAERHLNTLYLKLGKTVFNDPEADTVELRESIIAQMAVVEEARIKVQAAKL